MNILHILYIFYETAAAYEILRKFKQLYYYIINTLALVFAYLDVIIVGRLVAERQARITLHVMIRARVVLGAHLVAAGLL